MINRITFGLLGVAYILVGGNPIEALIAGIGLLMVVMALFIPNIWKESK